MNQLRTRLESGEPVVTAELPVIDGGGLAAVRAHVARLAPHVDAVNATDNTAAHAHVSNVSIAIALAHLGVDPILQVVCRDKNRLALQADIMGAALHGVVNVCCLTGDDVTAGDEPEARRVFDLDSPQLVRTASALANGRYLSGRAIDPPPDLFVGAVENPGAPPYAERVRRATQKAAAGARFLQLQTCYRPELLEAFTERAVQDGLTETTAMLATLCLVRGPRALRYMDDNVPGIEIPDPLIAGVEGATDPREAAYQVALEQARHALALPGIRGLHIIDFRHDDTVERLRADLGLTRAPAVEPESAEIPATAPH
ncbi:methylenetetrahydrofolate reductase [Spiractinospora alimapuensis]|uniref:methylenetetrahydrofolate reductase n=1 Tax=Spiractinospora alimapuensis TaxID=2820884 RepID=UPI001F21C880|nr:methylenetetrahydrofolate reductase [Spiractinospora alimapuensis]QVQ53355.1 methylenetetrahydrofolate reductase [Spiractinospora alimapuensis]